MRRRDAYIGIESLFNGARTFKQIISSEHCSQRMKASRHSIFLSKGVVYLSMASSAAFLIFCS